MTHVGTHIEVPRHCLERGADLAQVPVERLVGEAVLLDLRSAVAEGGVTVGQVQDAAARAGGIRSGDIVLGRMGPTGFFAVEALQWLVDQGMKLMGVDSGGVEGPDPEHRNAGHLVLFRAGVPLIENLDRLDRLRQSRFELFALPIPATGLDAFPLRVVAVEAVDGPRAANGAAHRNGGQR
jgi:arylformamidase